VLYLGHWLSSGTALPELDVKDILVVDRGYQVQCHMDMAWNNQLTELIDAGIPLRLRITATANTGERVSFIRTLAFDIEDYSYTYSDSSIENYGDSIFLSKRYPQILLAVRDVGRWQIYISDNTQSCVIEVELLPSRVSRLDRKIDMSQLWGQRKLSETFDLAPENGKVYNRRWDDP